MLFRKMLRDMKENKAQFIAIFLMIFLGVFIYAGVNSEWQGLSKYSADYYDETNLADAWVSGIAFTKEDVENLKRDPLIQDVERRSMLNVSVQGQDKKKLNLYLVETNRISSFHVREGQAYDENLDGFWLDAEYAKENHLKTGDELSVVSEGITLRKKILGLVLHPENVYAVSEGEVLPDHENSGFVFLSVKALPKGISLPFMQLVIRSENPKEVESIVKDTLHHPTLQCFTRAELPSYVMLNDEIAQHKAFGSIFPIVFLLIAVLTTLTTVSKLIVSQRLIIGILKAVGFRSHWVLLHYLSHIIVIAGSGAILGFMIGPMVLPDLIFPLMEDLYILPELKAYPSSSSVWLVIFSIVMCFLAAYYVCHRELEENAAQILRPNSGLAKASVHPHNSPIWKHLNFYAQWNLRDILRNKIRSLMAVVGVAGCMGLMYCAFGLQDTIHQMMTTMYEDLQHFEVRVNLEHDANVELIKERTDGEAVMESAVELDVNKEKRTVSLTATQGTRYTSLQRSGDLAIIKTPSTGIALSYNLAEEYDLKQGETLRWRILGENEWKSSVIKEIIHTPSSQGITLSKEEVERLDYPFIPTAILGHQADLTDVSGIQNIQKLSELKESMESMMEAMNLMVFILIFGAVVLGIVVLYNLGTFSYYEKTREMATLKVLGFSNRRVRKLLRQQNFWLTLTGILAGIPFGYYLIYIVISTVGSSMDLVITILPFTYGICVIGTLGLSMFVIWIVSFKVRKLDMVSALKSIE